MDTRFKRLTVTLAMTGMFSAVPAMAVEAAQEGDVAVRVPAGAKVRSIEVYLDVAGSAAREDQVAENPDSLLSIGRVRETTIDLKEGKLDQQKSTVDQPVLFYLYSPTSRVGSFEINVQSAKSATGFMTEGETPKGFVVEVVDVRAIGDTRGKPVKRFDDVSFKIGEVNKFPLELDLKAGRVLGVRVWTQKNDEELSIQIKASKKGKYPAHVLRRGKDGEVGAGEGFFNPDVSFTYRGAPAGGGKFVSGNPLERLADQINNYVKGQEKTGDITVPLKVRVQTGEQSSE